MTMCPAATKLSNILQFVKASYCAGEIDTERRREAIDLCVLHICLASPSTPIWGVKSSDPKLTVNWLVMVAKPADINQSDFLLVYQRRLPPPVLPKLIIWPSCYSVSEAIKKKTWLWSNVSLPDSQPHARLSHNIYKNIYCEYFSH